MKKNFLMFFLGAIALGAVAALVLPASEYIPQSSNNAKSSIYNENTTSESFEVSNPVVVQSEFQFVQPDVQNWEIGNNLELKRKDTGKSGIKSYTLKRNKFLQE
ncbi:MAG: hypothetical protein ISS16_05175 [Ignavibacteria bacterium]|nr:hypothetical protein [Ignavibacteria bacterium]